MDNTVKIENTARIEIKLPPKLKEDFNKYCHYYDSTITEELRRMMRLCVHLHKQFQQHAKRPVGT